MVDEIPVRLNRDFFVKDGYRVWCVCLHKEPQPRKQCAGRQPHKGRGGAAPAKSPLPPGGGWGRGTPQGFPQKKGIIGKPIRGVGA